MLEAPTASWVRPPHSSGKLPNWCSPGWLGLLWLTWLVSFCVLCCQRVATWRSTPPQSRLRLTTRHCRWVPWQGTAGMATRAIQFGLFLMQSLKFYYHPVEFELMLSVLTWPKAFLCKNFSEVDYSYFKVSGKKIKVKLKQGICIQSNVIITWSNIFMMLYSSLQWLGQNMNISLNPQKTHHTSPYCVSHRVSFVNILGENRPCYNGITLYHWHSALGPVSI